MTLHLRFYFPVVFVFLSQLNCVAQSKDENEKKDRDTLNKIVITANTGGSLIKFGLELVNNTYTATGLPTTVKTISSLPAFQISGDYYASKIISVGAAVSYQQFGIDFKDYNYQVGNTIQTASFKATLTRTQIGARILFHFYNEKRLDCFSGVRIGPTIWQVGVSYPDPSISQDDLFKIKGGFIGVQVLYFGLRGYFTENFGMNFELAVGSPYFASAGLNFRFLK